MGTTDPLTPAFDPRASVGAARLAVPPAVLLLHFAALHGIRALACRFHGPPSVFGLPLVPAHGGARRATEGARTSAYDLQGRPAKACRIIAWLAAAGVVAVALPALVARPCS